MSENLSPETGPLSSSEAWAQRTTLRTRCPNCNESVDVQDAGTLAEVACEHCGCSFGLVSARDRTRPMAGTPGKLGRFELIEALGQGAFGRVWKARDIELDRFVALKIPHRAPVDEVEVERFFREARAAAQLRHPGIVSVHEVSRDENTVYIVSDFVQAATLQEWMRARPPTTTEAVKLMVQIAEAMDHAHRQGVVHRDLKPANILIDGEHKPHITDFGLAKRDAAEATVTVEGQVLGTPSYMSPQQASGKGHDVDGRSDVYSLGVILFQLLTHELPFRGSSRMVMLQIMNDEPPSPRKLKANIPHDLSTITLKCLEKDPNRRYSTAGELAADLRRFLAGEPIKARPVGSLERFARWCRRNPTVASLAASLAALLVLVAVGSLAYSIRTARYAEREHLFRTEAEDYFRMTLAAIDEMLTEVGEESLAHVPQMEAVRKTLLSKALELYQQLLRSHPSHPGLQLEFARAQHRMGDIFDLLGEHEQAQRAYSEAIRLCEVQQAASPDDRQVRHQLAKSHTMLGESFRQTKPGQADEHYARALSLQEELHQLRPDQQEVQRELSRTLNNRGLLFTATGQYLAAEDALKGAIRHLNELTQSESAPLDYVAELGRSQINLGVLLKKDPDRDSEAEASYLAAVGNLQRLVERDHANREYRRKLAVAMVDLGNLLMRAPGGGTTSSNELARRRQQAVGWTRKATAELDALCLNFPGIPLYQHELANARNSLANALVTLGQFDLAKNEFESASDVLDQLARRFPEYDRKTAEFQSLQGIVHGSLGAFEFEINRDPDAAQLHIERAIEHQREAMRLAPENPTFVERLAGHEAYLARIRGTSSSAP